MAQSHLDTLSGSQRINEGLALLRQAWRDAVAGVGLVFSGLGLMLAGALASAWSFPGDILRRVPGVEGAALWASQRIAAGFRWLTAPLASAWTLAGDILRRVPGVEGAARWAWQRIAAGFRGLTTALSDWLAEHGSAFVVAAAKVALWSVWAAVVVALFVWTTSQVDWMPAAGQFVAAIPAILMVVLGLGALVGVVLMLARVFGWLGGLLTPRALRALGAGVLIVAACALVTALVTSVASSPLVAWVALAAVFAGAAGMAVVSFGPTGFAVVRVGGWLERRMNGETWGATKSGSRARKNKNGKSTASYRVHPSRPPSRAPSVRFVVSALVGLALAVIGVAAALWVRSPSGTSRLQTLWAALQPAPAVSDVAPPSGQASAAQQGYVLGLVADGRAGDVYWRSGYRALTARMDDGAAVESLTLPPEACSAAAILAFGSASSDGPQEPNMRLARHRALWAADWTRAQLASCPAAQGAAPTIIAVSLGQAASGAASNDQRRVRLIALGREADLRAALTDEDRLREIAESVFGDLRAFTTFERCTQSVTASGLTTSACAR